jgi:ABC-type branched-subunit amino acid transport system substrate-binding protein
MTRIHPTRHRLVLLGVAGLLALSACAGRDASSGGGGEGLSDGPGFDGQTITVGALTPSSGRVSVIGDPVTVGNQIYFDQLNAQGGVAGKYPVEVLVRDTKYESATAAQEYQATKNDVAMYVQILGTPVVSALLPDLTADGVVASPASLDSFWVREQNLLPWGGPYQIQVINGVDWYVNEGGGEGKTICSLVQDDAYGQTGQQGLEFAAEELGIELGPEVKFTLGTTDYTTQINQLQSAGCDAVLLTATPADAAPALGKAAQVGYAPQWLGQSPTWLKPLFEGDLKKYAQENLVILAEGGAWDASSSPGMKNLLEALETYAPDQAPDWYITVGWAQARATHQVLEAAVAREDLSREGIIEAMNGLDEITADGMFGDYGWGAPEDRDPSRNSTIYAVDIDGSPIGITPKAPNYTSEAAAAFSFDE